MNGRKFQGKLKNYGLSWPARARIVKFLKITLEPLTWLRRRAGVHYMAPSSHEVARTMEVEGIAVLNDKYLGKAPAAVAACTKIRQRALEALSEEETEKGFNNKNIIQFEDYVQFPELVEFALDPEIIGTVSTYLGGVPVIGTQQLWWSKANEKLEGSQQFHLDKEDLREVKMFLNVLDVEDDNGPFTYISAPETNALRSRVTDIYDRVSDESVSKAGGDEHKIRATGPAGTTAMADPCRILHYGSRIGAGERLILMTQYVPYHCVAETKDATWNSYAAQTLKSAKETGNRTKQFLFDLPWSHI